MRQFLVLFFFCSAVLSVQSQTVGYMATRYNDSFMEWDVLDQEESVLGELVLRWQDQGDWTVWDYDVDGHTGYIKQKYRDDPTYWEVRGEGMVVTVKTNWKNDFSEWRITDDDITLTLFSRNSNNAEEWAVREEHYGRFYMYTSYEGDPRDWKIESTLSEEVPLPMQMALIFMVLYNSTPKE